MIVFDYQDAMSQAKELNNASDELYLLINNKLKAHQTELKGSWESDSAGLFFIKLEDLMEDMEKTAKKISRIASNIQKTAKMIKQAEEFADQIIKNKGF